jgi:flagellar hook-associated protein 2
MRIGGLASGMDIDQLVSDLMKAERMPLNKLAQKKQLLEWRRDDYREMNKLLTDLDTFIFDGVFRQATYTKKTVTSSKEDEVSVRNINATSNINATIKVEQLAKAAYMNSSGDIRIDPTFDPNAKLSDQVSGGKISGFASNEIKIKAIKSDGTMPSDFVTITFDPNVDSLNSVLSKINNSDAGVIAFYDSQTGQVSLAAKNTGDAKNGAIDLAEIEIQGDFLTTTLKLDSDNKTAKTNNRGEVGTNAIFTINGLKTSRPSNTFQISGYEYTLKMASNTDITITSTTDVDSIYNSIKAFIDKYNETIDKINAELNEKRYRDYPPLTDEQKEEMTEKQIELWEEKARSGMLRGDSILSSALNKMRIDLYTTVSSKDDAINNKYDQLSEIGITTSSDYLKRGKLEINEAKLKEAISADPDAIYKLFANDGEAYSSKGLARRLRDTISDTIKKIEGKAGKTYWPNNMFSLGRDIDSVEEQIDAFEERLVQIEDRYWRQFSAMEQVIQQSNQQSFYLMQQFGGR